MKIIVNEKLYVRSRYIAERTDFYQYKYSRNNYYLNLALTKDKIINIKRAIEDGFEELFINK